MVHAAVSSAEEIEISINLITERMEIYETSNSHKHP